MKQDIFKHSLENGWIDDYFNFKFISSSIISILVFWDIVSSCILDLPSETLYVDQTGLKVTKTYLSTSDSQVVDNYYLYVYG